MLDNRVEQILDVLMNMHKGKLLMAVDRCESPIEQLMALVLNEMKTIYHEHRFVVAPQAHVGPYRVDFKLMAADGNKIGKQIIVECDGHDFHEKTKEQAKKDKQRDRYLQQQGYQVLRFTGSEIWANPFKCAEEVIQVLLFGGAADGNLQQAASR